MRNILCFYHPQCMPLAFFGCLECYLLFLFMIYKFVFTISVLLASCACTHLSAQMKAKDLWSSVDTRISGYGHNENHYEVSCTFGYNFTNSFSVGLVLDEAVSLFKKDGIKDHYVNSAIGAKVSYDVLKVISFQAGSGITYDNKPWKYAYYDAMICFKEELGKVIPTFGFGMRYYDSMAKAFSNHLRAYVSFGCVVKM